MAKAKAQEKEIEVPAETAPPAPKENLIPCTVAGYFCDGNLADAFRELGYGVEWTKGEKRKLPMWLINRVQQSGGEIELLRG